MGATPPPIATMSLRIVSFAVLLTCLILPGCGLATARSAQDWTAVTDTRLFRCCHIGNDGSGVLLLQDAEDLWILTNAVLVSRVAKVHVVDPTTRRWSATTAWVAASDEAGATGLALLRAEPLPFLRPFATRLADPLVAGAARDIDLLPVSVSDTPRAYRLPAVGRRGGANAAEATTTPREPDLMCVHGGVRQANDGTPIFDGDNLVGLASAVPLDATIETVGDDGSRMQQRVTGIGGSTPQAIEAFLRAHGHGALADRLVGGR